MDTADCNAGHKIQCPVLWSDKSHVEQYSIRAQPGLPLLLALVEDFR
jgi:hypothetical protein